MTFKIESGPFYKLVGKECIYTHSSISESHLDRKGSHWNGNGFASFPLHWGLTGCSKTITKKKTGFVAAVDGCTVQGVTNWQASVMNFVTPLK